MQNAPQFTALRRRWRWLLSELYKVQEQIEVDRSHEQGAGYTLDYKEQLEAELNELDWVFQFFNRTRNGYHLSQAQLLLLLASIVLSLAATFLLLRAAA